MSNCPLKLKKKIWLAVYSRSNLIGVTYIHPALTHSLTHWPVHNIPDAPTKRYFFYKKISQQMHTNVGPSAMTWWNFEINSYIEPSLFSLLLFFLLLRFASLSTSVSLFLLRSFLFELFFCKKIPLSRRVGYVMDRSMRQWVSEWVRDVCMSHQSDWIYYKQPIKFLFLSFKG